MIDLAFHPGLVLIAGAGVIALLRGPARSAVVIALPVLGLFLLWRLPEGAALTLPWLGQELLPVASDRLSRLFATVFLIAALGGGLYALTQPSRLEIPAAYVYAGSALGVTLAGDLVTLFVFWELMALASSLVIWSAASRAAYAAGLRYLMVHLLGGMLLFAGITGHIAETGDSALAAMTLDTASQWLMLAGFLVNAAAPPLSAWLPDAYPESSFSGMVFLSAFTTKAAVYVLMRAFPGTELLVWVGLFMVFYGTLYALLQHDLRRVLAYGIVNQVGFMLVGVGIGTEIALNGVAAHAFVHVLYKGLLVMSAGAVLQASGARSLADAAVALRRMPLTAACLLLAALTMGSFPLTAGFISKAMISQAAAEEHNLAVWLLLGVGTVGVLIIMWLLISVAAGRAFLSAGIALPGAASAAPDEPRPAARLDPAWNMGLAMGLFALLCLLPGVWPQALYGMLPYTVDYRAYTGPHVVAQMQLLLFSGLAFYWLGRMLRPVPVLLDFDWLWRASWWRLGQAGSRSRGGAFSAWRKHAHDWTRRAEKAIDLRRGPHGAFLRTRSTRTMALAVMLMLMGYLVLYYAPW
jgi:multicomponent Na+:H+ antiporter subunit D